MPCLFIPGEGFIVMSIGLGGKVSTRLEHVIVEA